MAIKWILTCDGDCPDIMKGKIASKWCPGKCPKAEYEREYLNTELPDDAEEREYLNEVE